ncbi:hypothetical protein ACFLS9_05850 [Bacteroidota bacterium]
MQNLRYYLSVHLFMILFLFNICTSAQYKVTEVNFLESLGLKYNAQGPTLVKCDTIRNRIFVANSNSSTVSVINGVKHKVINIPITTRAIQHLKDEAFIIDKKSGNALLIGNKCLHVVLPEKVLSKSIKTNKQYEMVAVDENTGNAFLVGRESNSLAYVDIMNEKISYIKYTDYTEELINLNQTPPPPIRKVLSLANLNQVYVIDGYTSNLITFNSKTGEFISSRELKLTNGARWHYAGINENSGYLYLVIETADRKVIQAGKIDLKAENDVIVNLPGFTEGVGINYNIKFDEVYIPYDNHPSVHIVEFSNGGSYTEVKLPQYGNDASAINLEDDLLFVASWAYGEIEIVNLKTRKFICRIPDLGIIPHTFTMEFNSNNKHLYIPIGASAVNGVFGSAITAINTETYAIQKIYTGWGPVDLIERRNSGGFIILNSEDEFTIVDSNADYSLHKLPFNYPHNAIYNKMGNVYISYGPHQSYWPTVYIWGAKNGIMQLNPNSLEITDRRIPRLAQDITVDESGILYTLQNNWGNENQFITILKDEVREFNASERIVLEDKVERETIQRQLKYDKQMNLLYLLKTGEKDQLPGVLQIIDVSEKLLIKKIELGLTPTDLKFDYEFIYITNFDSNSLTKIRKSDYNVEQIKTGNKPLRVGILNGIPIVLNHIDNTVQVIKEDSQVFQLPSEGLPDNIEIINEEIIITSHSEKELNIYNFDLNKKRFQLIHQIKYPYGEVTFNHNNCAFYVRGQFGDSLFDLTNISADRKNRLWVTDYLSGKLFIIERTGT